MIRWILSIALLGASATQSQAQNEQMEQARHALHHHHGGASSFTATAERLEVQSGNGDPFLLWDGETSYGPDEHKLKLKTEGHFDLGQTKFNEAELHLLITQATGPFFDVQYGVRQDWGDGPALSHLVVGVEGLLPYFIETGANLYFSDDYDLTASVEFEYEVLFTQRLIFAPRVELSFAAQHIPEREIGAGLTHIEMGARLRYDVSREIAPYLGVSFKRAVGRTSAITQSEGAQKSTVSVLAGLRLWY